MRAAAKAQQSRVTDQDRKTVASEFNQIRLKSERDQALAKLSNSELSKLAHEHEIAAAHARYALWRRSESWNAKN